LSITAKPLHLHLSAKQLDAHCRAISARTRQSGQTLTALTTLQAFITETAQPDQQTQAIYLDIKAILEQHIAAARGTVMEEHLAHLLTALAAQNLCDIQQVHAALSRNGFHQIALTAIQHLPEAALPTVAAWVSSWCHDAKARAEAASGYPDALDLRGADIAPERYAAMSELNVYLQSV
jgi:hypothetical protein